MKKILFITVTALSIILSAQAFSAEATQTPAAKPVETTSTTVAEKKPIQATIDIYESANTTSKIIKKVSANQDLIPIYHEGQWVKVGDRQDGTTGWINIHQYREA